MIVKANVKYKDGTRGYEYFLVRFDHSPIKETKKKHRRIGICSIYYLTDDDSFEGGSPFSSTVCGDKFKYYLTYSKVQCHEKDNYVKAFTRIVTLQNAFKNIIALQRNNYIDWNFLLDNISFKDFMNTLKETHSHGMETAFKLLQDPNYITK